MSGPLFKQHRRMLEQESALVPEVIGATGYRTVTDKSELLKLGFKPYQVRVPGLLVPIRGASGEIVSYQFRPDEPRRRGDKPVKYESLPDRGSRLHFPPTVREKIQNPGEPLIITEGVRKADCAAGQGLACLALPGVWNWKTRNEHGGSVILGDFENVPLRGRDVYLCFDSDTVSKEQVRKAEARLAGFLRSRGARVYIARIPHPQDGSKVGLDDYVAAGGDLRALLERAEEFRGPEAKRTGSADKVSEALDFLQKKLEVWRTTEGIPCVTIRGERIRHLPLRGSELESWVRQILRKERRLVLADTIVAQVVRHLEAMALEEGCEHPAATRIAWADGACWLNLADEEGRIVRIASEDWQVVGASECPVRFLSSAAVPPLPVPTKGGSLDVLFELVGVPGRTERALVVAWLTGVFCPSGTRCLLQIAGPKGSGKSQLARVLRTIVDPHEAAIAGKWRDSRDLDARLANGYVLVLDNVRKLSGVDQDELCIVLNDSARTCRELFTNTREITIRTRRPVLSTSIEPIATQGDLADRTLTVRLKPLRGFVDEATLRERLEEAHASILGALLDRVRRAMASYRSVKAHHRLTDFVMFAQAACESGKERAELLRALDENRAEMHEEALERDPALAAIMELTRQKGEFEASISGLLQLLGGHAARKPGPWPKTVQDLTSLIDRNLPTLREFGVEVESVRRNRHGRKRRFRYVGERWARTSSPASPTSPGPAAELDGRPFGRDEGRDVLEQASSSGNTRRAASNQVRNGQPGRKRDELDEGDELIRNPLSNGEDARSSQLGLRLLEDGEPALDDPGGAPRPNEPFRIPIRRRKAR